MYMLYLTKDSFVLHYFNKLN